jgi:signal transduction histidine kinase
MFTPEAKSILVVDDNSTNLSVLSQALKIAGYKVRAAMDGESAIAQGQRKPPDLILLDVQMPGIDGFETCSRLKADVITQNIPVIFMTALGDAESKLKGLSLGAVDYITKPFEQEEVLARVKIHLQLKALTDTLEQQVTERTMALQSAQIQLLQQEKLSSLGQLVAGVAHEINNPIGAIANNIPIATSYVTVLENIIRLYQKEYDKPSAALQEALEKSEIDFVLEDLFKLLNSLELSSDRIKDISVSLRTFSRADTTTVPFNLHDGIDSTLLILRHRLKAWGKRPEILAIKQYGNLPEVKCYPGQMNQVFMNLIANAIDALEEAWEKQWRCSSQETCPSPTIQIQTEINSANNYILIRIADNGLGMTEELKQKIFSPFFTTKAVGVGTGMGLAISYQIITEQHGGLLECCSQPGQGTEFSIQIPLK